MNSDVLDEPQTHVAFVPVAMLNRSPRGLLPPDPLDVPARFERALLREHSAPDEAIAELRLCLAIAHDFRPAREALHRMLMRRNPDALEFAQINIEVTNKCSNRCYFCPRDAHVRQQGVMSHSDFVLAVDRIVAGTREYVRRIDVQSFGESVLDRDLPRKIRHLTSALPYAYVTLFSTLAMPLKEDYLARLLSSGLDEFVISLYATNAEDFRAIYGYDGFENVSRNLSTIASVNQILDRPVRLVAKMPHERMYKERNIADWSRKRASLIATCQPHGFTFVESEFTNFGGGRSYNEPKGGICSIIEPSKRGMVVTWNLDVNPCCIDFNGTMKLGNLREQSLREIFDGGEYLDFVRAHRASDLAAYPVCAQCDLKWDLESSGREAE